MVTHIDADGITAGSIAAIALDRLGKEFTIDFEKKITDEVIDRVNGCWYDLVWVCDLGSAYMSRFVRSGIVVTDHHVPDPRWRSGQTFLDGFMSSFQLNPHLYGRSGSFEVCGAGMTYLLSKALDPKNTDLAYLAVIGAVGDFQDGRCARLVSYNRLILQDAVDAGDITVGYGVRYFGRGTRPVLQFLQYGGEPHVDGITNDRSGCLALLDSYGIKTVGEDGRKLTWTDLNPGDRAVLTDELMSRLTKEEDRNALFGEIYAVNRYPSHSGLGDAKEFSTILNSCGRYDDAVTGERICMGDLSALEDAERNRSDHRRNISSSLTYVKANHLVRRMKHIQYFDAGTEIKDTVVGIVAGMILGTGEASDDMPIFAFAAADDGIKVSARASRALTDRGLDLSDVIRDAAASVGGMGGGHSVAAGATIPEDRKEPFLEEADRLVAAQLGA